MLQLEIDWREKSKCRQWLKSTSVFPQSPALWREWGGNWQGPSVAGEAEGWVGNQATPVHPQAVSRAASPAPGIRHLPGAGAGLGGSWRLSLLHFILSSLPSLTYASENLIGTALSLPGECSLGCLWSPVSQGCATSWGTSGVSPQTLLQSHLPVILPRNASFSVEEGIGGSLPCPPSLLRAWVPACPSKGQTPTWALSSPLCFWDLRARCCCPALYFHTIISIESAQSLRAGLSPKSRHKPARGWADVPIPRKKRPARCHPRTEQGQHTKGPFWKGLSQEKGPKAQK